MKYSIDLSIFTIEKEFIPVLDTEVLYSIKKARIEFVKDFACVAND